MNTLKDIPKIKRLADKFGNKMIDVTFVGEGIQFKYKVGDNELVKEYSSTPLGIRKEIERFEKLLKTEIP